MHGARVKLALENVNLATGSPPAFRNLLQLSGSTSNSKDNKEDEEEGRVGGGWEGENPSSSNKACRENARLSVCRCPPLAVLRFEVAT